MYVYMKAVLLPKICILYKQQGAKANSLWMQIAFEKILHKFLKFKLNVSLELFSKSQ